MSITDLEALDKALPINQKVQISDLIQKILFTIPVTIAADATGGQTVTVPYDLKVIEIIVQCTAANGSGTLTLRQGTTAISDAMICAVDKVIVRAGTLDDDETTITTSESINVIANGASDRGIMYIIGLRV